MSVGFVGEGEATAMNTMERRPSERGGISPPSPLRGTEQSIVQLIIDGGVPSARIDPANES